MRYSFKYYTDALDTIARLENEDDELEDLLKWCVGATEEEAEREGWGVAPLYHKELATLYKLRYWSGL
jgi:hypothetical protein